MSLPKTDIEPLDEYQKMIERRKEAINELLGVKSDLIPENRNSTAHEKMMQLKVEARINRALYDGVN